jgi:hypothetical protein
VRELTSVELKARRYVVEGRLSVERVDPDGPVVEASVRGSGAVYAAGHDEGGWYCSCPARTTCSHLLAVQLVVTRPGSIT